MQLTWENTLPVWWSFFWRACIFGVLLGVAFGSVTGIAAAVLGAVGKGEVWGGNVGLIAFIPASIWAMKNALSKHLPALAQVPGAKDS